MRVSQVVVSIPLLEEKAVFGAEGVGLSALLVETEEVHYPSSSLRKKMMNPLQGEAFGAAEA